MYFTGSFHSFIRGPETHLAFRVFRLREYLFFLTKKSLQKIKKCLR